MVAREGFAEEFTARAFDDEPAGGDVPEADAGFDITVEPAGRYVNHREGGGTHQSDLAHPMDQLIEQGKHDLERRRVFREPHGDDGFVEFGPLAHADRPAIEAGGTAGDRGPELVAEWVINDTDNRLIACVWV